MSIISDDNDFKNNTPAVKKNPVVKPEAIELDKNFENYVANAESRCLLYGESPARSCPQHKQRKRCYPCYHYSSPRQMTQTRRLSSSGFTNPTMERRVELFPAPLAPIKVTTSPFGTAKLISFTALIPP